MARRGLLKDIYNYGFRCLSVEARLGLWLGLGSNRGLIYLDTDLLWIKLRLVMRYLRIEEFEMCLRRVLCGVQMLIIKF